MNIFVRENAGGNARYYYSDVPLSTRGIEATYVSTPSREELVKDHGQKGADLYQELVAMNHRLPVSFALTTGYLKVTRNPAAKWSDIEPEVFHAIGLVHNDFDTTRQSVLKRAVLALRRLFSPD